MLSRIARRPCLAAALLVATVAGRGAAQETATLRWPLRFQSTGIAEAGAALVGTASEPRRFETRIEGDLAATTMSGEADLRIVAWRVDAASVSFSNDGRAAPAEARRIDAALRRPTFAELDADGRIAALRFDPELGPFERSVVTTLLATLQFTAPRADPPSTWVSEEASPNGRYQVRYAVVDTIEGAEGEVLEIEVRKARHLAAPDSNAPLEPIPELALEVSGARTALYDPARERLVALAGTEVETITLAGRSVGRTETTVELGPVRPVQAEDGPELAEALAGATPPVSLISTGIDPRAEDALARRATRGSSVAEALAELAAAEAAGVRPPLDAARSATLRAFAAIDPVAAESLAVALARAPAGSLTMHALAWALAAAGEEHAHAALASALRQRIEDPPAASFLIAALGSVERPTAAAEATLRDLALGAHDAELAHAARLALGVLARRLAGPSPERAAAIVAELIAAHGPRPEGEAARRLLLVLGNTGSPAAIEPAQEALADSSPALREAAVGAVRFVRPAAAESLLVGALAGDPAAAVRLAALDALAFRPSTDLSFAARAAAARGDSDASVRIAALQSLWADRDRHAGVGELIDRASRDDPSPEVRRRAGWLLGGQSDHEQGQ